MNTEIETPERTAATPAVGLHGLVLTRKPWHCTKYSWIRNHKWVDNGFGEYKCKLCGVLKKYVRETRNSARQNDRTLRPAE